jgi:hypothetical protein
LNVFFPALADTSTLFLTQVLVSVLQRQTVGSQTAFGEILAQSSLHNMVDELNVFAEPLPTLKLLSAQVTFFFSGGLHLQSGPHFKEASLQGTVPSHCSFPVTILSPQMDDWFTGAGGMTQPARNSEKKAKTPKTRTLLDENDNASPLEYGHALLKKLVGRL